MYWLYLCELITVVSPTSICYYWQSAHMRDTIKAYVTMFYNYQIKPEYCLVYGYCWVKPRGSVPTAVLICMLVSNNVLLKCSSECSFLLPSHEISIALNRSLPSCYYQAEQVQQMEQQAIKTLMHVISAQCILEWCAISINTQTQVSPQKSCS